MNIDLIFLAKN